MYSDLYVFVAILLSSIVWWFIGFAAGARVVWKAAHAAIEEAFRNA